MLIQGSIELHEIRFMYHSASRQSRREVKARLEEKQKHHVFRICLQDPDIFSLYEHDSSSVISLSGKTIFNCHVIRAVECQIIQQFDAFEVDCMIFL